MLYLRQYGMLLIWIMAFCRDTSFGFFSPVKNIGADRLFLLSLPCQNTRCVNLYLFNPENDLAIAFGGVNYTPPPAAQLIGRELSLLPLWYADEGTPTIIAPPDSVSDDFRRSLEPLGLSVSTITWPQLAECRVDHVNVWGWNHDLTRRLRLTGVAETLLPTPAQCDRIRALSHRRLATEVGQYLSGYIDYPFPKLPIELHTPNEVRAFTEQPEHRVLKAPWSGSGRGLYWNLYGYDRSLAQWSNGVLQKQGVLMGEPFYDKVSDWAMEFHSDGRRVTFAGYSSFLTDGHGAYKSNRLATDDLLCRELCSAVGDDLIEQVRKSLIDFFTTRIASCYRGYFGVDMMLYRTSDGTVRLHPFVEVNLRMNMGMVARRIADRFVAEGCEGVYRVDYYPRKSELYHDHLERQHENPAVIRQGKFVKGYFALTPVWPHSRYRASIEVSSP